jgi:hypothetical protein
MEDNKFSLTINSEPNASCHGKAKIIHRYKIPTAPTELKLLDLVIGCEWVPDDLDAKAPEFVFEIDEDDKY